MKCLKCGDVLTVHIGRPDGTEWFYKHYCESCHSYRELEGPLTCGDCGLRFSLFLEQGFLGCEGCYKHFAPELDPLLEEIQGKLPGFQGAGPGLDSLARARTQEVVELVRSAPQITDAAYDELDDALLTEYRPVAGILADQSDQNFLNSGVLRSVRIRVARNIRKLPYWIRMAPEKREKLSTMLLSRNSGLISGLIHCLEKGHSRPVETGIMSEKQLTQCKSRGLIPEDAVTARLFPNQNITLYTGDEDHLRIQWFPKFGNKEQFQIEVVRILSELAVIDRLYEWQYGPENGFLNACPANCGSGVRVSFLMNLTGVKSGGNWLRWKENLRLAGFELRGGRGEGSRELSEIQISNRHWSRDADLNHEISQMLIVLKRLVLQELKAR